jgi:tetratricopeptide (TPR) repeat protein
MPGIPVHVVRVTADTTDLLAEIKAQVDGPPQGPVMILGLERALEAAATRYPILEALNLRRPEWPGAVGRPVVLWVPERVVGLLLRGAPDFFDWRSDTIVFPELAPVDFRPLESRTWMAGPDPRMTAEERRQRIEELRSRIAAQQHATDPAILTSVAGWWDEIADHLKLLGELDEALRIRQEEELPVYERLGDVRSRAITQGKIADVLQAQGQLDEALRIRQEEELPVYERLGDVRSHAVTRGQIADILQDRGQLDEALRIRQEEELPAFARLGDVHSRAITQGKIADILQDRGQLDEALRIHQEEELPVYERLGDVRSRAITQGRIAGILAVRGQFDEALRIRQEEELPVYERLGDAVRQAAALWSIATIHVAQGHVHEALPLLEQAYLLVERVGQLDGISAIGTTWGPLLAATGRRDEGVAVLRRAEAGWRQLGRQREADTVEALILKIEAAGEA